MNVSIPISLSLAICMAAISPCARGQSVSAGDSVDNTVVTRNEQTKSFARYYHEIPEHEKAVQIIRAASDTGVERVLAGWPQISLRRVTSDPSGTADWKSLQHHDLNRNSPSADVADPRDKGPRQPLDSDHSPSSAAESRSGRQQDRFIPVPAPLSQRDSERQAIDEIITNRYRRPVTVRVIRELNRSQSLELFSEVSQKIDERSLEQPSYDVRHRRALRNLTIALDNPTFLSALGLSEDSFRLDGFRNTLARLASVGPVGSLHEARDVLLTVMKHAQNVPGLPPGVIGFEFTNASIDILDNFSGLELSDPALRDPTERSAPVSDVLKNQVVGIGVEVREHPDGLIVVRSLRGGPADDAGIRAGDLILSINGRNIRGMNPAGSVDLMTGPEGSRITVSVDHEIRGLRKLVLTRRTVRVWTVNDVQILSGTDVGYLSLSRFSLSSAEEIEQALNSLHSEGMKSLIIDLRGNPGGLLTTCIEISDRFIPCGTLVSTRGRLSIDNMIQEATYLNTWSVPLVVLVDHESASASEIFAAAIQENRRGVVVGVRTYGKGSVQTHFPLTSVDGDLRLTTALFYSPTGRKVSGNGVVPDIDLSKVDELPERPGDNDRARAAAVRVARSSYIQDMATAAGRCRSQNPPVIRSSVLDDIVDPVHPGTRIL